MNTPAHTVLYGHEKVRELLAQLNTQSLLFVGPRSVGKRQVARWYAQRLNCEQALAEPCGACHSCQLFQRQQHPDYRELAPRLETKSGRASRRPQIRIDALVPRAHGDDNPLSRWLESRPQFKRRVGVIDQAETLNEQAANAFLKMLEEPPSYSTIILIAESPQALLATLVSRCAIVRFGTVALNHHEVALKHPLARLGKVGDILLAQEQGEQFTHLLSVLEDYIEGLGSNLEIALEKADAMEKAWQAETQIDIFELLRAMLSEKSGHHYAMALDAIERCELALESYASASIAWQVLTLDLRAILKAR